MAHSLITRNKAIKLRRQGYSLNEISQQLKISKGSASLWLKDISLNIQAQKRLTNKRVFAQKKANNTRKNKRNIEKQKLSNSIHNQYKSLELNPIIYKLLCSFLFWAEGNKNTNNISFINSDPIMIKTFLKLFRKSFNLDEKKFRGLVHIHEYHNEKETIEFWSNISKIPINQFQKSYKKPHSKIRKRDNYKGSFRIRYYDAKISRELTQVYTSFAQIL